MATQIRSSQIQPETSGHIVLTPSASKFVKVAVLQQDITTDTYKNNAIILTGWSFLKQNSGGAAVTAKTITFGITFATAPMVVPGQAGLKYTSAPTVFSDLSTAQVADGLIKVLSLYGISTTAFNAEMATTNAGNAGLDTYRGFCWIAIGTF